MTRKAWFLLWIAVAALVGWLVLEKYDRRERINIEEIEAVKIIDANRYFVFENMNDPELVSFVEKEGVSKLVRPGKREFDKILLVKEWVRRQLGRPGYPDPYPPWKAPVILDWVRTGRTGAFCGQYAVVFAQALIGLSIPVRYVNIFAQDGNSHFLTEVWSRDYNKWIVMDPYLDRYYEYRGLPLSALEISRVYRGKTAHGVNIVEGSNKVSQAKPEDIQDFYNFEIVLRNNHWHCPVHIHEAITGLVPLPEHRARWGDPDLIVPAHRAVWGDAVMVYEGKESEPLFYWRPNICQIKILALNHRRGTITLQFNTLLEPTAKYLLLSGRKYWIKESIFEWELKPGYNALRVVPIDGADMQATVRAVWQ